MSFLFGDSSSGNNRTENGNASTDSGTGGLETTSRTDQNGSSVWQTLLVEVLSMGASYAVLFIAMKYFMKEMDPNKKQKDEAKASKKKLMDKLVANGRVPFVMNDYESIIANDLIYPEDIDVNFSMIGGLEDIKNEVFDIVALPLQRPDLFSGRSSLLAPPKGILLYGPPGTGKTMMAKAIAKESGAAFINLQMSTTMNKWFGESQKLVRATFTLAWKLSPCVLFIDEIDSFLRERSSVDHAAQGNMKAEFMALWDGLCSQDMSNSGRPYGVIVIGATNRPYDVDQAILRRMPRQFKLSLPDARQRLDILKIFLEGETLEPRLQASLAQLAEKIENYSGSDIKELCQAAAMRPFREFAQSCRETHSFQEGSRLRALNLNDFQVAMNDVKATGQAAYEYHEETQGRTGLGLGLGANEAQNLAMMMQALSILQQQRPPSSNGGDSNKDLD